MVVDPTNDAATFGGLSSEQAKESIIKGGWDFFAKLLIVGLAAGLPGGSLERNPWQLVNINAQHWFTTLANALGVAITSPMFLGLSAVWKIQIADDW
eukprot:GSA25T00017797001.1